MSFFDEAESAARRLHQNGARDFRAFDRERKRKTPLELYRERMISATPYYEGTMCDSNKDPIGPQMYVTAAVIDFVPQEHGPMPYLARAKQVLDPVLTDYLSDASAYPGNNGKRGIKASVDMATNLRDELQKRAPPCDNCDFYSFDSTDAYQIASHLLEMSFLNREISREDGVSLIRAVTQFWVTELDV
jgi:hypothetical protein